MARSYACSMMILSRGTRSHMPGTISPSCNNYPGGQNVAHAEKVDLSQGSSWGAFRGTGLRKFLEGEAHAGRHCDKDGANSVFERELRCGHRDLAPFWPATLRHSASPRREAEAGDHGGIGSDHVDLQAAIERG